MRRVLRITRRTSVAEVPAVTTDGAHGTCSGTGKAQRLSGTTRGGRERGRHRIHLYDERITIMPRTNGGIEGVGCKERRSGIGNAAETRRHSANGLCVPLVGNGCRRRTAGDDIDRSCVARTNNQRSINELVSGNAFVGQAGAAPGRTVRRKLGHAAGIGRTVRSAVRAARRRSGSNTDITAAAATTRTFRFEIQDVHDLVAAIATIRGNRYARYGSSGLQYHGTARAAAAGTIGTIARRRAHAIAAVGADLSGAADISE